VADLYHTSLRDSFAPAQWKQSNIIPIPKVTNQTKPSECRPVYLTSCLGKAMEKIIAKDILRHTKAIWKKSDQFLPGRNTMHVIVKVIDDWERALDNKETIHAVFFDFSKAFDLVNHKRLMQKLKKLPPPYLTPWIAEWLSDRKQRVKCGNTYYLWELVAAGVIQGSVLGPILFLLYISDINEYLPAGAYHSKRADDILAYSTFIEIIDDHTQQSINGMASWSEDNHMRLNTIKTQHMIISKK
jgi:hypothetical protein